jgi:cytochrome c-type biogenesis protein CcmH
MIWLLAIVLAFAVIAAARFVFRLQSGPLLVLAAAMALGLAFYGLQGRPGLAGTVKPAAIAAGEGNAQLIAMRRVVMGTADQPPARHLLTSDAFARRGQYERAAAMLRGAVRENPRDTESWVALGNVLVEHAGARLTPAAMYAYRRAAQTDPATIGPDFFIGAALIRQGRLVEARSVWAAVLGRVPEDAPFRAGLEQRLDGLDQLIARVAELEQQRGR